MHPSASCDLTPFQACAFSELAARYLDRASQWFFTELYEKLLVQSVE